MQLNLKAQGPTNIIEDLIHPSFQPQMMQPSSTKSAREILSLECEAPAPLLSCLHLSPLLTPHYLGSIPHRVGGAPARGTRHSGPGPMLAVTVWPGPTVGLSLVLRPQSRRLSPEWVTLASLDLHQKLETRFPFLICMLKSHLQI